MNILLIVRSGKAIRAILEVLANHILRNAHNLKINKASVGNMTAP